MRIMHLILSEDFSNSVKYNNAMEQKAMMQIKEMKKLQKGSLCECLFHEFMSLRGDNWMLLAHRP